MTSFVAIGKSNFTQEVAMVDVIFGKKIEFIPSRVKSIVVSTLSAASRVLAFIRVASSFLRHSILICLDPSCSVYPQVTMQFKNIPLSSANRAESVTSFERYETHREDTLRKPRSFIMMAWVVP